MVATSRTNIRVKHSRDVLEEIDEDLVFGEFAFEGERPVAGLAHDSASVHQLSEGISHHQGFYHFETTFSASRGDSEVSSVSVASSLMNALSCSEFVVWMCPLSCRVPSVNCESER